MSNPTPGLLASALADAAGASPRLLIRRSQFNAFDGYVADTTLSDSRTPYSIPGASLFRFVVGDFPLGMRRITLEDPSRGVSLKTRENWVDIYHSLSYLLEDGYGVFLVEPAFWTRDWRKFTGVLRDRRFFLSAAFRFVDQSLPGTTLRPVCAVFSRRERDSLFVADIAAETSVADIATAFHECSFGGTISTGVSVAIEEFRGFDQVIIERELSGLQTQYKSYEQLRLVPDLAPPQRVSLCRSGASHTEVENAVYIPRVGTSGVVAELGATTLKHHNYIQVQLNPSLVTNRYLALYFRSRLGRLSLQALTQGSVIAHLPKAALESISVPVPKLDQQAVIVDAHSSLLRLEAELLSFRDELSLNPASAAAIHNSVDAMLGQVNSLSQSDEILGLVRRGESKTLEFKETLSLDVRKGTKEKYIEGAALKTIAALLNSQGGTLLVGVTDAEEVVGVNRELDKFFKGSRDEFLKHFKNIVRRSIGEEFYPLVDYELVPVAQAPVLRVDCQLSDRPCFLNSTDFFVRTNPATDKLEGPKMLEYVRRRFQE